MAIGIGVLGFSPLVFWQLTPREFEAALNGRLGLHGEGPALTRRDLDALMQQYPDKGRANDGIR